MPLSWNEIRSRAHEFSRKWVSEESERAEAQSFWNDFFAVFGIERKRVAIFEKQVNIARADDTTYGILHSRFHELWSLRLGTSLEDRPRYTPTTTFETFPFPAGLTPRDTASVVPANAGIQSDQTAGKARHWTPACAGVTAGGAAEAIAATAAQLNALRETWLNPPEWVDWVRTKEEEQAGFPLRPVAKPGHEAELKKRTLTNLYNARPAWLDNAHRELDAAVAAAYGWTDYTPGMPDEEILKRLLALNLARSAAGTSPSAGPVESTPMSLIPSSSPAL